MKIILIPRSSALTLLILASTGMAMAPDSLRTDDLTPVVDPMEKGSCPLPDLTPESIMIAKDDPNVEFKDLDRDLKNVGTDFVVEQFFSTPETLYNFLSLVYKNIDNVLTKYKREKGFEERAIFLLFKGGNVLRMVANRLFDQLPADAKKILKDEYIQYFKRSDADFSVYIDQHKLGKNTYDKVLIDVTNLVFAELSAIRQEFHAHPEKYFYLGPKRTDIASERMAGYFNKLPDLDAVKKLDDSGQPNKKWYGAKFYQFQLKSERAQPWPRCNYLGAYDARYEAIADQVITTRLSPTTDWIVNTDNRNLGWTWGSDPSKAVKFYLVRSKAYFEYIYELNGEMKRKAVGGELIDVSIPHRDDDRLQYFLDGYDKNVATYTIIKNASDWLSLKAYSLLDLAEDLQFILLDSFDRPWKGGPKYNKRVYRLFFLFTAEQLGAYGLGADTLKEYANVIRQYVVKPIKEMLPLSSNSTTLLSDLKENLHQIEQLWPKLEMAHHFWHAFANFLDAVLNSPQEGDEAGLKELMGYIERNLNFAEQLSTMQPTSINLDSIYTVDLKDLF